MESSADSYLHKKFKKQLSIEPKPQNYDKENKNSARTVESSEEKAIEYKKQGECNKITEIQTRIDNNECVPNQSTNINSPSFVLNSSNFSKSSISVEKCIANQQSSNSCISYVVSNNLNNEEHYKPISFDTTFSTDPTNSTVSVSSILDNSYSKQNYKEDISSSNLQGDCTLKLNSTEDILDSKAEEIQPPPDRNSSGKYVCTYCNLVCSKPSVLQKHIRAHTNERPYPCISCGFSFKTRSNLYKHCRSRSHANRVMGNKSQDSNNEMDNHNHKIVNPSKSPPIYSENKEDKSVPQDMKLKPYKPRFHTGKQFLENIAKENIEDERQNKHATSELLSHHINEIINKNNSIINSRESTFMKKRFNEVIVDNVNNNEYIQRYNRNEPGYSSNAMDPKVTVDEPLNLTNKNRKRCMSEIAEPVVQKSLIKELLLKNLYSSDMQCPYCKMIFQTVTELDVHKYRNCKCKPSGVRYTRSSSVNVASILTQNKNAFDNIPHLQNTIFPLNSPGPFLGKTRLVDTDKSKSFSFDSGNLPLMSPTEMPQNYLLSPLQFDKEKKTPVKLFGGEVKIHSSGETKSFKIDNNDDKYESDANFIDYGGKLSENRVIKSSLQSGGTVLTNKTNYNKQDIRTSQDIIRVFENTSVSPSIDITSLSKPKFTFDHQSDGMPDNMHTEIIMHHNMIDSKETSVSSPLYKYTNIMDFSQKAVKMLTPNIKQPNFCIPGAPLSNKMLFNNHPVENKPDLKVDNPKSRVNADADINRAQNLTPNSENENYVSSPIKKQFVQRKIYYEPQSPTPNNIYNPVNLFVNGKVIRYVPGMPGPVAAESPVDMAYGNNIVAIGRSPQKEKPSIVVEKLEPVHKTFKSKPPNFLLPEKVERINKSPKLDTLEIKTDFFLKTADIKSPVRISESKSPVQTLEMKSPVKTFEMKSPDNINISETKKFARPNSLALKPTTASLKQHHGLTPTMFNQILISPDTPRVAKKYAEHFLHGNYFSYLGLKSSTKPVYCTLNKTQPFYVPHFKKLSMYSEWRQQDTKTDKLYVSNYNSSQHSQKYTMAGKTSPNLIIHSSYKFMVSEAPTPKVEKGDDQQRNSSVLLGGYESNEDYTYIRGRGRGRYVCDQCGIRCKKPSMLKKHIRTHSNDRPYTCSHCNFSFKTKGNLTKHMKSKAHTKNYTASNSSSSSNQQSATQSSESDTDDSGMDSSDESTRQQEHEAAYGLLSLSQKPAQASSARPKSEIGLLRSSSPVSTNDLFMTTEEIAYVSKTSYARNKILDERNSLSFSTTKNITEVTVATSEETTEAQNIRNYLGKASVNRPLTYPYTSPLISETDFVISKTTERVSKSNEIILNNTENMSEPKCIKQFHVIQKYAVPPVQPPSPKIAIPASPPKESPPPKRLENVYSENIVLNNGRNLNVSIVLPTLKVNDVVVPTENLNDIRKRKFAVENNNYKNKVQRNDEVMDLSMTTVAEKQEKNPRINGLISEEYHFNNIRPVDHPKNVTNEVYNVLPKEVAPPKSPQKFNITEEEIIVHSKEDLNHKNMDMTSNGTAILLRPSPSEVHASVDNYIKEPQNNNSNDQVKSVDYDNSAMETLADIATQREKLDKNTLAKSVATEFLKLATKNESLDGGRDPGSFGPVNKDVNDIIVKSEGNKSCTVCSKSFNKPSQLRLHMNIHYLERPFRCDSCSVSFRTKGHLQKHERSASHHNKLSSSPALSSSEPRPFKCSDCNIAFRIHGHLAKHLRSKMHIMKLECLAKIPFGLYAELERSNSLLTEINTCDGDQCLESLKTLAKKVFINDPNKLNQLEIRENVNADS